MVILEGVAFPLDQPNSHGWGIPLSDADNAISSLRTAVVRVCSRSSPHGCDVSEDPKAEIGKVIAAWKDGGVARARVDITDTIADQKIRDGTWPKKWSIFGGSKRIKDGWTEGASIRSLTLVQNPAWEQSEWEIAASDDGQLGIRFFQEYSIQASVDDNMPDTPTTPPGGPSPAELAQQLADKQKVIDDLTTEKTTMAEQLTSVTKERDEMKAIAASKDAEIAKRITHEDAKTMIAAAIEADHESQAREAAMVRFAAARKELNLETKPEDFKVLSAADLNKQADELTQIKASSPQILYAAGNSSAGSSKPDIYDPVTRSWS